jgi:nitrile hydratase accessory protein
LSPPARPDAIDLRGLIAPESVAFDQPWQAHAYALAYELHRAGAFTWAEWTRTLGARLACHPDDEPGGYYVAWLEAVETLVVEKGAVPAGRLHALKAAWQEAYETTPHGKPVELPARSAREARGWC